MTCRASSPAPAFRKGVSVSLDDGRKGRIEHVFPSGVMEPERALVRLSDDKIVSAETSKLRAI